ncbi:hypothetical protein MMC13_004302 [Lambiella insularis]|nr:hypothetical protein [Lambiella insularis]
MVATDAVKRWVITEEPLKAEGGKPSFGNFRHHLQQEQLYNLPRTGCLWWADVENTKQAWHDLQKHRDVHLKSKRYDELKRQHWDITAPFRAHRDAMKLENYSSSDWSDRSPEIEHDHFQYMVHPVQREYMLLAGWILGLPTLEDKYIAMLLAINRGLEKPIASDIPLVAHVLQFDDLQAAAESERKTGYAVCHDLLNDEILIRPITWLQGPYPNDSPMRILPRPDEPWSSSTKLRTPQTFRGSPATIARQILQRQEEVSGDGMQATLDLIVGEWLILMGKALKNVQHPASHRGTFTDKLMQSLEHMFKTPTNLLKQRNTTKAVENLYKTEFPDRWNKSMVDLDGFKGYWGGDMAPPELLEKLTTLKT